MTNDITDTIMVIFLIWSDVMKQKRLKQYLNHKSSNLYAVNLQGILIDIIYICLRN